MSNTQIPDSKLVTPKRISESMASSSPTTSAPNPSQSNLTSPYALDLDYNRNSVEEKPVSHLKPQPASVPHLNHGSKQNGTHASKSNVTNTRSHKLVDLSVQPTPVPNAHNSTRMLTSLPVHANASFEESYTNDIHDKPATGLNQFMLYSAIAVVFCILLFIGISLWVYIHKRKDYRSRKSSLSASCDDQMKARNSKDCGTGFSFKKGHSSHFFGLGGRKSVIKFQPGFDGKSSSPQSPTLWGSAKEYDGDESMREKSIPEDEKFAAKQRYEALDFGPLLMATAPSEQELMSYKQDAIIYLTQPYGGLLGMYGSDVDRSPRTFSPASSQSLSTITSNKSEGKFPDHLSTIPSALLTGNLTRPQRAVFRPLGSPSLHQLNFNPAATMSLAEASSELQKIVDELAKKGLTDELDPDESVVSIDVDTLMSESIIGTNPENFPNLKALSSKTPSVS